MVKRLLFFVACLAAAVSCGPSKYAVQVEMRYPSRSGIDLAGKIVSVVYLENGDSVRTAFTGAMADGFAYALEQDYATGEGSVGIYRLPQAAGADYASRDTLVNMLMDTGADVVFLFEPVMLGEMTVGGASHVASKSSPDSAYVSSGNLPFNVKLYCFDAMDRSEKVHAFGGGSVARPDIYSDGKTSDAAMIAKAFAGLSAEAWELGTSLASSFEAQWKHEQYSVTYFDGQKWRDAVEKAYQYDWKGAMDIWMDLLSETNDLMKRSCAEYNISIACYMLGDYRLASEWLDRSDADAELPLSDAMRKRIAARL